MALKRTPVNTIRNERDLLVGDDTWTAILEPALCEDSAAVECLARLLFTIKKAIDDGPDGARRASSTLSAGIELIYLYTDAHKAARKLYVLSLIGQLKPQDEPLRLINEAIEREEIEDELGKKGSASKKKRR